MVMAMMVSEGCKNLLVIRVGGQWRVISETER